MSVFKKFIRIVLGKCPYCGTKYKYGTFGYGCSFKYCPNCDLPKDK